MYQCITSNLCIHHTRSWRRSRCLRSRDSIGRWKKQWKRRSAELGAEKTGRFPWRFRKETMRIYGDSPWESMGIYGNLWESMGIMNIMIFWEYVYLNQQK